MTPETRKLIVDSLRLAADRLESGDDCVDNIVPMLLCHDLHRQRIGPDSIELRRVALDHYEPEHLPIGDEEVNDCFYRYPHPTEDLPQWGCYITMVRSHCSSDEPDKNLGYGTKTVAVWQKIT